MSILLNVLEVLIAIMDGVAIGLDDVSGVEELDGVAVDSNVGQELLKVTPGGLIDVGEDTLLELLLLDIFTISVELVSDLSSKVMLVPQKISNLGLVNRHSLGVHPLSGVVIMLISGLEGKVLLLADSGKLGLLRIIAVSINLVQADLLGD